MNYAVLFAIVTLATVTLVGRASAATIYDNGVPPAGGASAYLLTQSVQAEDFTLAEPTVVAGLRFYALEHPRAGGYAGSIYWSIRAHESGQPSANEIASATTSAVVRTFTGVIRDDYYAAPQAIYGIDIEPLALGPGHYWLVLHNGPLDHTDDGQGFLRWEATVGQSGSAGLEDPAPFDGEWQQTFREHSFALVGIPEPGTLLGLSGVAMVLLRRQRATLLRR